MTDALGARVAVVTGASRGIGRAIVTRLATAGCDLVLAARDGASLAEIASLLREDGRRVAVVAGDLRTLEGCTAVRDAALAFPRVDILVNCAGATQGGPLEELGDDIWHDGFALKFFAAVRLSRLLWPQLRDSRGTVVNIVGGFARTPDPDFAIGGAVNAALANFTKALAGQGLRDDVNVNAIHPGMTVTERLAEILETRAKQAGKSVEEMRRESMKREGIRRLGQPEDVADLVAFLCSPAARHINGTAIAVDGGGTPGVY